MTPTAMEQYEAMQVDPTGKLCLQYANDWAKVVTALDGMEKSLESIRSEIYELRETARTNFSMCMAGSHSFVLARALVKSKLDPEEKAS